MNRLKVRDVMSDDVISVREDENLARIHDLMMDERIRHVPVVDDENSVVGLISHRDLLGRALAGNEELPATEMRQLLRETKAREIMVRGIETIEPTEDLEEAAALLMDNKFGCLPVTLNERLVGILTEGDFVRCVAEEQRSARDQNAKFTG